MCSISACSLPLSRTPTTSNLQPVFVIFLSTRYASAIFRICLCLLFEIAEMGGPNSRFFLVFTSTTRHWSLLFYGAVQHFNLFPFTFTSQYPSQHSVHCPSDSQGQATPLSKQVPGGTVLGDGEGFNERGAGEVVMTGIEQRQAVGLWVGF